MRGFYDTKQYLYNFYELFLSMDMFYLFIFWPFNISKKKIVFTFACNKSHQLSSHSDEVKKRSKNSTQNFEFLKNKKKEAEMVKGIFQVQCKLRCSTYCGIMLKTTKIISTHPSSSLKTKCKNEGYSEALTMKMKGANLWRI